MMKVENVHNPASFGALLLLSACLGLAGCQSIEVQKETADTTSVTVPGTGTAGAGGDLLAMRKEAEGHYQAGNYPKALPLYEGLTQRMPKDALSWFQLGNVQARLKQNDPAIKSYERAVQLDPKLSKAWHNMGLLQLQQSANSFTQMAELTNQDDPLSGRAIKMSQGTLALLDKDPKVASQVARVERN